MKILAIGANGTIGTTVIEHLAQNHQVIAVGHSQGPLTVDIEDKASIRALFEQVGKVDAIISLVGKGGMGKVLTLEDSAFTTVLDNKLMGQVNLVRLGAAYLNPKGSITLTSGQAANHPMPGTAAIAMGVAAIEAFVKCTALELEDDKRINAVSPALVKETMVKWGMDSTSGIAAKDVASYYQASVEGTDNGHIFNAISGQYKEA